MYRSLLLESVLNELSLDRSAASRDTVGILRRVTDAVRRDSFDIALREIDRAWRCLADDTEVLAPLYGRLLALSEADHDATLRLLQRVITPDPDVAALKARALLHLLRGEEARATLASALSDFCVVPGGLLAHVATEFLSHPDTQAAGWIGLGPALEFLGELKGDDPAHALDVRLGGGAAFTQPIRATLQGERRVFQFKLPQLLPGAALHVSCHGVPLLGSGLRIPSEFALDGRAAANDRLISGWARLGWMPGRPVSLCVEDEDGRRLALPTRKVAQPGPRWPFSAGLRQLGIRGNRLQIFVSMPDGRWLPLPDSPLLRAPAVKLPGRKTPPLGAWRPGTARARKAVRRAPPVDVIIPVYRGRQETLDCIASALATVGNARIVVVDDATDDPLLAAALDDLEAAGRITLLRNATNLGFVASVNRALTRHRSHDAVLLNSDALVFGDWLKRLRAAAYRAPNVGTATPFSNSGTIASYPRIGEYPLSADQAAALNDITAEVNDGVSHEIPVGVGFCLYLRRDCLREVGELDASVFGRGYGEETDFCMRARGLGWTHHLAADVFVYHAGGLSFGSRRMALLERSQRLINLRCPGYDRYIADFMAKDPLLASRRNVDERRLVAYEGSFVLVVTLALTGGVQRFVAERCREIRAKGLNPLVLRPARPGDARRCELWTDAIDVPNLRYAIPSEIEALGALLGRLHLEEVEIQHFLHIDPRVIDLVRSLEAPYDVFVHDYAWICPRVTLIDGSGRYCGEPDVLVCNACVKRNGSHLGSKISVSDLRRRSAAWMQPARRVIAPSADTAARLRRYFTVPIEVRAHAPPPPSAPVERPTLSKTVRVAVLGAIGEHKGYRVLLNCARDAKLRALPLDFIVIGYTEDDGPLLRTGKVFITGRYSEGEAPHLLRRERPDIAFLPSVWPETWCYVLDEAAAVGLPIVAFDLGAIAERLIDGKSGTVLPLDMEPRHINDRLLELARPPGPRDATTAEGTLDSQMPIKTPDKDSTPNSEALSASVQVLPLPSGLYLFSVKAAAAGASDRPAGQLRLPAIHIGLGPGVRSDQVEFVTGLSTDGAWLFAQEDMLVTKVNASGATLVLTSVRAPGGEVLSIKVERLESRAEGAAAAIRAPAPAPIAASAKKAKVAAAAPSGPVPVKINAHIRARGDMSFTDVPWAGRVAPGLWIESFAIKPMDRFEAGDIEYKGLTGSGFETPWMSDEKMCGTKGMSVPLVGFAVRLKPGPKTGAYDCEYSGFFKSGITIGPLRNGAPCRSTVANDPLEGLQVTIQRRPKLVKPAAPGKGLKPRAASAAQPGPAGQGPSFGRYREVNGHASGVEDSASRAAGSAGKNKTGAPLKPAIPENHTADDDAAYRTRPVDRRS